MTFVGMSFLVELQGPTKKRMKITNPHKWTFTARFRRNAFGRKGSRLTLWTKKRKGGQYEADTLPMIEDLYHVLKREWDRHTQNLVLGGCCE